MFSVQHSTPFPVCQVDGLVMPAGDVGKCLGYWWKEDLSASRSVEENIQKACGAFFHSGSIGVFQVDISPLSFREATESCVMPLLLYGSQNWVLTDTLIEGLESFQGELAKRMLKWLKHHSNTAAITTLDVPTMKSRVLVRKLRFPKRVKGRDADNFSGYVVLVLCDEVDSLCLVRECKELEEIFGTSFTEMVIAGRKECCLKEMKKMACSINRRMVLVKCAEKTLIIAKVAEHLGWAKLL